MHRVESFLTALAVLMLAGVTASPGYAQGGDPASNRSPRFFFMASPKAIPVEFSSAPILRKRVTVTMEDVSLQEVLTEITRQTGVRLVYSRGTAPVSRLVSLKAQDLVLAAALTQILFDTGLDVVFWPNGQAALMPRVTVGGIRLTASIRGRVTDARTGAAIAGATVQVDGHGWRAFTDQDGKYRIMDVDGGAYTVIARRLGFMPMQQRVTVESTGEAVVNFMLNVTPTILTEMVTTATGERSRLEVGNAIGTIKADSVVATSLIRNMSDLLTARTPGVVVMNSSGLVGSPSTIRIRGVASASLSNDPIIILDGMRLTPASNQGLATTIGSSSMTGAPGFSGGGQRAPARLDDIDPNTIESIDVLRGPAASSLYGTDAAAGVIVIKTKQGAAGSYRFNVLADDGSSHIPGTFPTMWVGFGHLLTGAPTATCFLVSAGIFGLKNVADHTCIQDSVRAYQPLNDPRLTTLGTGGARNLSLNLSGGTGQLREFLSLRLSDATGITKLSDAEQDRIARMWGSPVPSWMRHPNTEQNINGASRTNLQVTRNLDLSFTGNVLYRSTLSSGTGTLGDGVDPQTGSGIALGYFDTLVYLPAEAQRAKIVSMAKRGYGAATASYTPLSWLVLRGTLGGDYTLRTDDALGRASDCTTILFPTGCPSGHANSRGETYVTTIDVGAQATWAPRNWVSLRTSVGQQYGHTTFYNLTAQNDYSTNLAFGTSLLTPGPVTTTAGAQLYDVTENRDESATTGWYLEETAALRERLFLTASFRQDLASAFGSSVNARPPVYPKYSLSWLVSDEPFFPKLPLVSSFRLRTAYGHSGQEANQTAVLNNFVLATALVDGAIVPGMVMSGLGNPTLRPERTAELEGGFDLSLLDNERLHVEATIYRKLSNDAISYNSAPLSFGSSGTNVQALFYQSANLGRVENRGWELATMAKLIDSRAVAWTLTVNATRNVNRLVSCIGVSPGIGCLPSTVNPGNYAGYPLNSFFGHRVLGYSDLNGDGRLSYNEMQFDDKVTYFGTTTPESELTYVNSLSLWNGVWQVNVNVDQVNGLAKHNTLSTSLSGSGDGIYRAQVDPTASIAQQAAVLQAASSYTQGLFNKSNTVRVAEVSMTWNVPKRMAADLLRAHTAAVTFAGRNLALWTTYVRKDPNVDSGYGSDAGYDVGTNIPQPQSWTFRISLGY